MKRTTIIFDLDGTLLDTLDDLAAAANEALTERGLPTHETDTYRQFIGRGVENLVRRAIGEPHPDIDGETAACLAIFQETYSRQWNVRSTPYEGVAELLDELTQRKCQLAVLSNKPHDFAVKCVSHFFGKWEFEPVFGQRPDVPHKPDPTAVHEIISALATSHEQSIYVGDSDVDMETAGRSGVTSAGACWGFRTADELKSAGADHLLHHPLDLLKYL